MKKTIIAAGIALFTAITSQAQTNTIADWDFDNLKTDPGLYSNSNSPEPVIGAGSATVLGMTNDYNDGTTPSLAYADILSTAGASTGSGSYGWRIRGGSVSGGAGTPNGWSTNAPIATQGAEFAASTAGNGDIQVSFDLYTTSAAEGLVACLYTTDGGGTWTDAAIVSNTNGAAAQNNSSQSQIIMGPYMQLNISGGGWYNHFTVDLSGVPAVDNNPNFAIEIVNAATGTSCSNQTGGIYNNSSGNWRYDNILITGTNMPVPPAPPEPIVEWNFEGLPQQITPDPAPSLNNAIGAVSAACIGMQLYGSGTTNGPDVTQGATGDTGSDGITNYTQIWRIRGNGPGSSVNGWTSTAPIGSQGAQFSVDTTGFTNIQVAFDWYLTKQGEANLQFEYTVDGINWSNLPITIPAAQAETYLNFSNNTADSANFDSNSVQGYFVSAVPYSNGQQWFTNLSVVITDPLAASNPNFAVRMVNASTGASCINGTGTALNNTSGNWRFDNIYIIGVATAQKETPPVITPAPVATVDGPFTNTFTDNANWRNNLSGIKVNGTTLTNTAYVVSAGQIVFIPSASTLLELAGTLNITINATNYNADLYAQAISPGAATSLVITSQPVAPTGNGGTLVAQPALALYDQYNNVATNGTATFTAAPSAGWTFGGGSAPSQTLAGGAVYFTNLSAISPGAVSGATVTFTASGITNLNLAYTMTNSAAFNIPAPAAAGFTPGNLAVEQEDVASANSTFSILELSPTISDQSVPVNTIPVPATSTGSNYLRQSSSGSTGDLSDSQDGTLLCFTAALCGDSTVSDVTTINPRGAGTINVGGQFNLATTYVGLGGSTADQARSAATIDDVTYFMGDKGGVYTNGDNSNTAYIPYSTNNPANVRGLKAFGGVVYALQQEGGTDPNSTVLAIVPSPSSGLQFLFPLEGFPTNGSVLDFYMLRSGNNGTNYDTAYYIDGTNTTSGAIYKYYFTGTYDPNTGQPIWVNAGSTYATTDGSWPTPNGGVGFCAVTNVSGGADLYYTTGSGGSAGNSVIHVHDSGGWNQPINITATNLLYTTSAGATLKGIAFAPLAIPGAPLVATWPVSSLTANGATLNAFINPNGSATKYWFSYGPVGATTNETVTNVLASGSSPEIVSASLAGLAPGFYQYQITASNSVAGVSGATLVFATAPVTRPNLSNALQLSGGLASLTFTNVSGASFTLWGSTNLLGAWQNLGHPTESPAGTYSFTGLEATNPTEFYRVTSP